MIKYGLKIPIELDGRGWLRLSYGGDQLEKLIALAVSDHTNHNPFLSQFPNLGLIGHVDDMALRNQVQDAVNTLFDELEAEDRATLLGTDFTMDDDGTLAVQIRYRDTEESEQSVTLHLGEYNGK